MKSRLARAKKKTGSLYFEVLGSTRGQTEKIQKIKEMMEKKLRNGNQYKCHVVLLCYLLFCMTKECTS